MKDAETCDKNGRVAVSFLRMIFNADIATQLDSLFKLDAQVFLESRFSLSAAFVLFTWQDKKYCTKPPVATQERGRKKGFSYMFICYLS